tara:strand:+ start:12247 stop:12447 length:201 start_codon:yes stop_codon:yes gene_type:complete
MVLLAEGTYEPLVPYNRAERKEQLENYEAAWRMIPKLNTMQPSILEKKVMEESVDPDTGEKLHKYL